MTVYLAVNLFPSPLISSLSHTIFSLLPSLPPSLSLSHLSLTSLL